MNTQNDSINFNNNVKLTPIYDTNLTSKRPSPIITDKYLLSLLTKQTQKQKRF